MKSWISSVSMSEMFRHLFLFLPFFSSVLLFRSSLLFFSSDLLFLFRPHFGVKADYLYLNYHMG